MHKKSFDQFFLGKSPLYYSSFELLKFKDCRIVLLGNCKGVKSDSDLRKREQIWIDKYKRLVVNTAQPFGVIVN